MRALLLLASLLGAAALVALVSGHLGGETLRAGGAVVLVGDSLHVGIEPYLPQTLEGWTISSDSVVGRATPDGVAALEALGAGLAPTVAVSLGTNDPQDDAAGFRRLVERVLEIAGPQRCVVWLTIWRGGPSEALNDVLHEAEREHDSLRLVDWAEMVEEHPEWLSADGVHGSEAGYERRAELVADAVRSCAPPPRPGAAS